MSTSENSADRCEQDPCWDALSAFTAALVDQTGVPGVAVGVLNAGSVSAAGWGVTSVENPLPVTDTTLFQIGSISKTFTATMILQLVEQGGLDLDVPVRSYVPDFAVQDAAASAQVTVRHLLAHLCGWDGDFFHDTGGNDDALGRYVADMADLVQIAPVGTHFSYNNAGFVLLGHLIELITEQPYHAALKSMLLDPLGLTHASCRAEDVIAHCFAVGHYLGADGPHVARPWAMPRYAWSAGGLTCHVHDLLAYARFQLGDGAVPGDDDARLLTPASMALMRQPVTTVWDTQGWSLGWETNIFDGVHVVAHGGGTNGQVSYLALAPEHDFAVVILTNASAGGEITSAVFREALKLYCEVEVPVPVPIDSAEDNLFEFVGFYSCPFVDIELGMLNGRLIGQLVFKQGFPTAAEPPPPAPPPTTLGRCAPDRLIALDGPAKDRVFDVLRQPDGSIGWLREGLRLAPRVD